MNKKVVSLVMSGFAIVALSINVSAQVKEAPVKTIERSTVETALEKSAAFKGLDRAAQQKLVDIIVKENEIRLRNGKAMTAEEMGLRATTLAPSMSKAQGAKDATAGSKDAKPVDSAAAAKQGAGRATACYSNVGGGQSAIDEAAMISSSVGNGAVALDENASARLEDLYIVAQKAGISLPEGVSFEQIMTAPAHTDLQQKIITAEGKVLETQRVDFKNKIVAAREAGTISEESAKQMIMSVESADATPSFIEGQQVITGSLIGSGKKLNALDISKGTYSVLAKVVGEKELEQYFVEKDGTCCAAQMQGGACVANLGALR